MDKQWTRSIGKNRPKLAMIYRLGSATEKQTAAKGVGSPFSSLAQVQPSQSPPQMMSFQRESIKENANKARELQQRQREERQARSEAAESTRVAAGTRARTLRSAAAAVAKEKAAEAEVAAATSVEDEAEEQSPQRQSCVRDSSPVFEEEDDDGASSDDEDAAAAAAPVIDLVTIKPPSLGKNLSPHVMAVRSDFEHKDGTMIKPTYKTDLYNNNW